jgi:hypothetical protein
VNELHAAEVVVWVEVSDPFYVGSKFWMQPPCTIRRPARENS